MFRSKRTTLTAAAAVSLLLFLAACGSPGLSADEAEQLRGDLATVQDRVDDLDARIADLAAGDADAEEAASEMESLLAEVRTLTEEVREGLRPPEPEPAPDPLDGGGGVGDPAAPAAPVGP